MINQTLIIKEAIETTTTQDFIISLSNNLFLSSIVIHWLFQFLVILILGTALVKEDKGKFFAIFVFIQLIGAIILFFIFIYPVIPQVISEIF